MVPACEAQKGINAGVWDPVFVVVVVTVVTVEGADAPLLLDELDEPELDAPFRFDEEPLLEPLVLELDPPKDV